MYREGQCLLFGKWSICVKHTAPRGLGDAPSICMKLCIYIVVILKYWYKLYHCGWSVSIYKKNVIIYCIECWQLSHLISGEYFIELYKQVVASWRYCVYKAQWNTLLKYYNMVNIIYNIVVTLLSSCYTICFILSCYTYKHGWTDKQTRI